MPIKKLNVFGKASGKTTSIPYTTNDLEKNFLHFLQEQEVPIASSCRGRMACHRCIVNGENLACAFTLNEFILKFGEQVEIDYL